MKSIILGLGALLLLTACTPSEKMVQEEPTITAPTQEPQATNESTESIAEIASSNPDFSTLVAALTAADLVDILSEPGEYTVFAPTNEAFEALPEGALDELLSDPEALTNVLTYHVLDGVYPYNSIVDMSSAVTLSGDSLEIAVSPVGAVTVNKANVLTTDIMATNGVIHVIDTVLLP